MLLPVIYQGSDKGGGVVQRLLVGTNRNANGAQRQNSVHGTFFCSYKIQNTTFSDSENNSKSALQNPMHLKLKIAEHRIANMICPNDIL